MGEGARATGAGGARLAALGGLLVSIALGADPASAQRDIGVGGAPGGGGSGVYTDSWAVVIGINDYHHPRVPKLRYAVNDARSVEATLLAQGFRRDRIVALLDAQATKSRIERVLGDELKRKIGPNDRLLVFFAGHGMTDRLRSGEEEGYLIPADGDPGSLFSTAVSMTQLRQISDRLRAKHILYVVDACYSGYALFNRSIGADLLEEMVKKPAIQILTAGRQGDQAQERAGHGVFTEVLIRGLQGDAFGGKGWLALEELGVWMKQRVFAESDKKQLPQFGNLSGEGQFVFLKPGAKLAAVQPAPAEPPRLQGREEIHQEFGALAISSHIPGVDVWLGDQKVWTSRTGAAYVLSNVPAGAHRLVARRQGYKDWAREVQVAANQRAEVTIDIEPLRPEPPAVPKSEDGAEMVLVPAGEFLMGTDNSGDQSPRHRVYLDAYYIDKVPVTNALYERFMRATSRHDPGYWSNTNFNGLTQPVVGVSWHDADAYCKWAGKRLPTEAEWEKAARGADGRKYPWGDQWDPSRANSDESKLGKTTPVGSYPGGASPYGALDMAGNVWQWVADWYDASYYRRSPERNPTGPESGQYYKVLRGGSWNNNPIGSRSSDRNLNPPGNRKGVIGFRCARGL